MDGDNFCVSVIGEDGYQGPLFGPYTYQKAAEKIVSLLKDGKHLGCGPKELSETEISDIELNGFFELFYGCGGIYICQLEK